MTRFIMVLTAFSILSLGCMAAGRSVSPSLSSENEQDPASVIASSSLEHGRFIQWGSYDMVIARDGSYSSVAPMRYAGGTFGMHLNAVKLLEVHPCTDCISLSNIHILDNGDVSVDVTLRHPWPAYPQVNKLCTGFDVRGVILFPASRPPAL